MEETTAIMFCVFIVLLTHVSGETKNPIMTYGLIAGNIPYVEF